ncbi:MAG TPA: hypothetical protein VGF07_10265 [Stellaceae bacterium]
MIEKSRARCSKLPSPRPWTMAGADRSASASACARPIRLSRSAISVLKAPALLVGVQVAAFGFGRVGDGAHFRNRLCASLL